MEEKKKVTNEITVLLIVIIISLIGGLGYSYNKYNDVYSKYEALRSQTRPSEKNENNNDYVLFVEKMKEERGKLNTYTSIKEYTYNWILKDELKSGYEIDLGRNGILLVNNKEVATNVLFYRVVYVGNGGYRNLYYVTEDGKVYQANVEEAIINNGAIKSTVINNLEKIVNIIPGGSDSGYSPLFIDIDGKIISNNS